MSRTDHHNPYWVQALHAAEDGRATRVRHRHTCDDYEGTWRPTHAARRVDHAVAEANGYEPARIDFADETSGWYRVPLMRHACEVDTSNGRCHRWVVNVPTRWYGGIRLPREAFNRDYFRPERAAVRDSLRDAAKEYRATGDIDTDVPTRQTRNSRWNGGYWD